MQRGEQRGAETNSEGSDRTQSNLHKGEQGKEKARIPEYGRPSRF